MTTRVERIINDLENVSKMNYQIILNAEQCREIVEIITELGSQAYLKGLDFLSKRDDRYGGWIPFDVETPKPTVEVEIIVPIVFPQPYMIEHSNSVDPKKHGAYYHGMMMTHWRPK